MQAAFHSQPNGVCRATAAAAAFAGVLDDYTTALAAAYLPFRGFSSYEGDGFTIRDTVGDAEQDVGFNAVTGELNAFTVGGSPAVKVWFNQAASNSLVQAVAAAQPVLAVSGIGSKPSLDLDGSNHYMDTAAAIGFASGLSFYIVMQHDTDGAWQTLWCETTGITTRFRKRADNNFLQATMSPNDDVGSQALGTADALLSAVVSGAATKTWFNNAADISTGAGATAANQTYRIGLDGAHAWYHDGKIAAVLAYNAVHNDATRQAIQTILADYFGITLA